MIIIIIIINSKQLKPPMIITQKHTDTLEPQIWEPAEVMGDSLGPLLKASYLRAIQVRDHTQTWSAGPISCRFSSTKILLLLRPSIEMDS